VDLIVLGSGTVAPTPTRTAPAFWLEAGDVSLLMDCGAGTLHRAATFDVPWRNVTHIALTHFHPDHWGELPFYLFALRWGTLPARAAPLVVLGPGGLRERLDGLAAVYGEWVTAPDFPLEIRELAAGEQYPLAHDVSLTTHKTPHTDESLAFSVEADSARLVYTGDTGPSEHLADWAAGCDVLLTECSVPDDRPMDVHLTPATVGALARKARPRQLVLTHMYPVFGEVDPVALVRKVYDGEVVGATDGLRLVIP
jgi:ribonuclease BN (tRNA processing enzyme)